MGQVRTDEENGQAGAPAEAARPLAMVGALVWASGLCALVYQIAWQREFRLIFGASTAASAAVLAVFMGGLGLGGWLIGPHTDRKAHPLRFYALLEVVVAISAAATLPLIELTRGAYLALGGSVVLGAAGGTVVRLVAASVVLLPATFFAGGTLGAAARAVEHPGDPQRRGTALLYGFNTLGAVTGCLLATFWLLEAAGTRMTLGLAALTNLLVAALAAVLARRPPGAELESRTASQRKPARKDGPSAPAPFVLAAAAVVGFGFFLMELVWYRMLAPILGGTVYTFGLVLAVALAGIGVGGLCYALVFRKRRASLTAFGATCLLEAALIALPYVWGDGLALLAHSLRPAAGTPLGGYLFGWTLVTSIVVFPAALVAGVQFPLLVALLGQGRTRLARHIGRAYLWNTLGAIAGALAGGFGLLPLLTAPGCWRLAVFLLVFLALAAVLWERAASRLLFGSVAVVMIGTLLAADGPTAVWRHSGIGVGRGNVPVAGGANALRAWRHDMRRSVVWKREGVESSVAVQAVAGLSFVINGKVDGNARNDAPTQVMGGLLGALLRPNVERSLVIGLGTGSSAGWLAALPGMQRVDVVELEPAILDVARMCAPVNHGAMTNPRVHVTVGDAREALTTGREQYGLIFSEPSNPYRAGVASLFTREFYAAVEERLAPEGVFLQWVQAYDVDDWTIASLAATLQAVFPEVQIWQTHRIDLLLIASRRPLRADAAGLRARLREEPFASALPAAWRAAELEDVLARFVGGPALTRALAERAPVNTDDRNRVEFAFARTLSAADLFEVGSLRREAAALQADRPLLTGDVDWQRVARQRAAIAVIAGAAPRVAPDASEAERVRAEAYRAYVAGDAAAAVQTFQTQSEPPEGSVDIALFAEGLAAAGSPAAVPYIRALRGIQPAQAEAATARLALRLGQYETALAALLSALARYRNDPWPSQVAMAPLLDAAVELTAARPEAVPLVFEALGQPFAVAALEEPRRIMRLSVESQARNLRRCQEALAPYERHVAWREDVLEYRWACYSATRDPRAVDARAELELFRAQAAAGGAQPGAPAVGQRGP